MKVIIFDNDVSTLALLKAFLSNAGHQPQVCTEPFNCALILANENQCPADGSGVDAMIINMKSPTTDNLDALLSHIKQECKLSSSNKAIMSTCMTSLQEEAIRTLGFHTIRKPFRLADILKWLERSI